MLASRNGGWPATVRRSAHTSRERKTFITDVVLWSKRYFCILTRSGRATRDEALIARLNSLSELPIPFGLFGGRRGFLIHLPAAIVRRFFGMCKCSSEHAVKSTRRAYILYDDTLFLLLCPSSFLHFNFLSAFRA